MIIILFFRFGLVCVSLSTYCLFSFRRVRPELEYSGSQGFVILIYKTLGLDGEWWFTTFRMSFGGVGNGVVVVKMKNQVFCDYLHDESRFGIGSSSAAHWQVSGGRLD